MAIAKWIFKKLSKGINRNDSVSSEFFSLKDLQDEALERESGQNTVDQLDKKTGGKVVMKIAIHEESENTIENCQFLKGLYEHSSSTRSGIPKHILPKKSQKFRYLVIEDFNTKGVQGDFDFNDVEGNKNQDLFNLFRSLGLTSKDASDSTDLGSWGMGKNMYAQTSGLGAFFGYSIRAHDNPEFLFGLSILKLHKLGDTQYDNTGNFGFGDDNVDSLVEPITDQTIIKQFKTEFNITRNEEKGLSLVVPCLYNKITYKKLVQSFIKTWSLGILKKEIEVHIKSVDEEIILTKDTINDHLDVFNESDAANIELKLKYLSDAIDTSDDDFITLNRRDNDQPKWWMDRIFNDELLLETRKILDNSYKASFKVPIKISYKEKEPKWGEFQIHLFTNTIFDDHNSVQYYRNILPIPGVRGDRALGRGYHAIVLVDGELASVMQKSEGPAHYQWSEGIGKYQELNLSYGRDLINFVSNGPQRIKTYLNTSDSAPDDSILSGLLGYEIMSPGGAIKVVEEVENNGSSPEPPDDIPDEPNPQPIYSQLKDGISFKDNPAAEDEKIINKKFTLKVSYTVDSGDPHSFYEDYQFNLSRHPISITNSGIEILNTQNNLLDFIIIDRNWLLKIEGFDSSSRELTVDLN